MKISSLAIALALTSGVFAAPAYADTRPVCGAPYAAAKEAINKAYQAALAASAISARATNDTTEALLATNAAAKTEALTRYLKDSKESAAALADLNDAKIAADAATDYAISQCPWLAGPFGELRGTAE